MTDNHRHNARNGDISGVFAAELANIGREERARDEDRRAAARSAPRFPDLPAAEREKIAEDLISRLARRDLTYFDEAEIYARLTGELGMTQKRLAERLGCSQSRVANKLRLLRFTDGERRALLEGSLTERHARTLLRLDGKDRAEAIERCAKRRMNVAHTEEMVDAILRRQGAQTELFGESERGERRFVLGDLRFFYNSIDRAVGMLRLAGYPAEATREENESGVEIRIAVSKPPRFT